jgi:hypothetical protein
VPQYQGARNYAPGYNHLIFDGSNLLREYGSLMLVDWVTKEVIRTKHMDEHSMMTSVMLKGQPFFISNRMQIYVLDDERKLLSLEIPNSGFYPFPIHIEFKTRGTAGAFKDQIYMCRPEFDVQRCFNVLPEKNARLFRVKDRIPTFHDNWNYLAVWDDKMHMYSLRNYPIYSKSIEISSLEDPDSG